MMRIEDGMDDELDDDLESEGPAVIMMSVNSVPLDISGGRDWFHRPLTKEEIDAHPDRDRIWATIEAVHEGTVIACQQRILTLFRGMAGDDEDDEDDEDGPSTMN